MAYQPPVKKQKDILYPVVSHGITMTELPGQVAVYIEFGNCWVKCPGCHSPHLTEPTEAAMSLTEIIGIVKDQKAKGATAVVLMGGPHNNISWHDLCRLTWLLSFVLPIGIYAGLDIMDMRAQSLSKWPYLKWLKTGPYKAECGGLQSIRTNQMFFERTERGWEYKPTLFWEDQK